jgi:hypothetical protein
LGGTENLVDRVMACVNSLPEIDPERVAHARSVLAGALPPSEDVAAALIARTRREARR